MEKRNIVYLLIVLLLGTGAWFLITHKRKGSLSDHLKDFAVKDTAAVTKIFIANKDNTKITLEKVNNVWMVNNKYRARKDMMRVLLETIHRVEVKSPVANSMLPWVTKHMATSASKVEIYEGEDLIKTYYVGGSTQDSYGTFMMLEDAERPFVTHIPGFFGYLTVRFNTSETAWRDRAVFRYNPADIEVISVVHPGDPEGSFNLKIEDVKYARLTNMAGDTAEGMNGEFLRNYLDMFREVHYESIQRDLSKAKEDSIKRANLFCTITVIDRSGHKNTASFYKRYTFMGEILVKGTQEEFDTFRLFVLANNGRDFASAQYRNFEPLIVKYKDFFGPPKPMKPL